MIRVQTGLESFLEAPPDRISGLRLGLLCNHASIDCRFHHAAGLINRTFPGQLSAMFSPQHGFHSDKQDNMIESDDLLDPLLRIPIYSLYGKTRQPSKPMYEDIDVLIVDLQDVGTRVYTFIYTMAYCMEAAKKYDKKIIVLDRPNPVGGQTVEGNVLRTSLSSFVGRYPIPMRHGMTIGELANLFNNHFGIGCDLTVVPMKGWQREMYFSQTGLPWVAPSPNLPTPASAMVYPGQVIWEGTNVSEGRGTTQPFELFGAPFVTPEEVLNILKKVNNSGIVLRPVGFEPTSNKWAGKLCRGFQIHVIEPDRYMPYATSLRLLRAILSLYGDRFSWKTPPYEYDYNNLPIDLIIGDTSIRKRIEALEPISNIEDAWKDDLKEFDAVRKEFLIY